LLTNAEVIRVNQTARGSHPVEELPPGFENVRVWVASGKTDRQSPRFLAVFNLDDRAASLEAPWGRLGVAPGKHAARNLWNGDRLVASDRLKIVLPMHASVLYAIE
jgi:hypothetical protein